MKDEKIIKKIEDVLNSCDKRLSDGLGYAMSENSKKELQDLLFTLKNDLMNKSVSIKSPEYNFNRLAKKIYKVKNCKPILKYAALLPDFLNGDTYTALTDSYTLIAKKGNDKINGLMYYDDYLKDEEYPNLQRIVNYTYAKDEFIFDRNRTISDLTKMLKLKENKDLIVKIERLSGNIYLDAARLLDVLNVVDANVIKYSEPFKPVILSNDNYYGLLSPMRVKEDEAPDNKYYYI